MSGHLQRLYAHLAWADELVLNALRHAQDIGEGDEQGARDARSLFAHVIAAEHLWLTRIDGRPARVGVWPSLSLDECAVLSVENATAFRALVDASDESALARIVTYLNSAGRQFTTRLDDILLHVAMHGSYHRGQVALVMRRAGATPAPTDFIGYVRGSPAAITQR